MYKRTLNLKYSANSFNLPGILNVPKKHINWFSKDVVVITDGVGVANLKSTRKSRNIYFILPKQRKEI
jgi:hypothetical protein